MNPDGALATLPLPAGDGEVTLFAAWSIFTHLLEADAAFYLGELARVLHPDGVAITTWFLFDKRDFPMMQAFQNALLISDFDPTNAVILDRGWLSAEIERLGLVMTHVTPPAVRGFQWTIRLQKQAANRRSSESSRGPSARGRRPRLCRRSGDGQCVSRARQACLAAGVLLVLLAIVHHQVLFLGRSLVHTNHSNPLDWRPLPQNYGEGFIPHDEWTRRGLWPFANIRDPGATWWQWEPSTEFLKQAIVLREWPFWDPYVAAGTPAMANLVPGVLLSTVCRGHRARGIGPCQERLFPFAPMGRIVPELPVSAATRSQLPRQPRRRHDRPDERLAQPEPRCVRRTDDRLPSADALCDAPAGRPAGRVAGCGRGRRVCVDVARELPADSRRCLRHHRAVRARRDRGRRHARQTAGAPPGGGVAPRCSRPGWWRSTTSRHLPSDRPLHRSPRSITTWDSTRSLS